MVGCLYSPVSCPTCGYTGECGLFDSDLLQEATFTGLFIDLQSVGTTIEAMKHLPVGEKYEVRVKFNEEIKNFTFAEFLLKLGF